MRINVTRSSLPDFEEYCREIRDLWDTHWLTNNGEKLLALQARLQDWLQSPVALLTNGHLALEALLETLEPGGEIVTTPFTFASTTHAIVRKGFTPVFGDIRPDDYTLDPDGLEALITPRTRAIVPVHVYGRLCDDRAIDRVAKRHGLPVFYDAAHAFSVTREGVSAALLGDAAMFSFHATKVFHTIEGGAVATRDPALLQKLELARNYGITGPEDVVCVGGNAKMNEFQAAMGLCNLRRLPHDIACRRRVHERYMELLAGVKGLSIPSPQPGVQSNYAYFPVVFDQGRAVRDRVCAALARKEVYARKYFYPLVTDFACYRERFDSSLTPVARRVSDGVLTLPIYPELEEADVRLISGVLREELER